ncbi:hypothetical protein RXV94_01325 [Yeosuana sp. MJ-SS3]|jgi:hypothetical protein|uniref:Carboxypeptidase regulatory-like domain-containing protein n=1 Tax=Gilvirhabdus luticola TaxID=3079858 RepID=A0ABU3U2Z7_9FLAO|nr:hypothetical protein [Yeosuana sp. MJ-SS3]MDU8884780.1 hypothetical protein [Yeosuana sp. MJ-SS3]
MKYVLFSLVLFLAMCNTNDDNDQVFCTEQFVYGLNVIVKDANTNNVITENIIVTIRDGDYEESLMNIEGNDSFFGAGERPGSYIIIVTSDNYQTYISETILVGSDECHVIPKSLEFFLQPN